MDSLLYKMYIKRYCLPSDTELYKEKKKKIINKCVCSSGEFNHIACIFKGNYLSNKSVNVLSYGINKFNFNNRLPCTHAEHDALMKLPNGNIKNNGRNINILVVRLTKLNKLQNSKPCQNCIQKMKTIPIKKGYKVKNIFYSDTYGEIVKTTLTKLEDDEQHHSRFYRHMLKTQN